MHTRAYTTQTHSDTHARATHARVRHRQTLGQPMPIIAYREKHGLVHHAFEWLSEVIVISDA
jgi:hypothetical protein